MCTYACVSSTINTSLQHRHNFVCDGGDMSPPLLKVVVTVTTTFSTCNLKFWHICSKCGKFMYRFWCSLAKTFLLPDPRYRLALRGVTTAPTDPAVQGGPRSRLPENIFFTVRSYFRCLWLCTVWRICRHRSFGPGPFCPQCSWFLGLLAYDILIFRSVL